MGKEYTEISEKVHSWIERQRIFVLSQQHHCLAMDWLIVRQKVSIVFVSWGRQKLATSIPVAVVLKRFLI